jgi:hypothetical protein
MSTNPYESPITPDGQYEPEEQPREGMPSLNAQELFGVAVRTIGLGAIAYGVWYFMWAFYSSLNPLLRNAIIDYCVSALTLIVIGLVMVRSADSIVRFAYPLK